ncbi:MAG TPA: hypothetical protein VFO19_18080, partial [Vicinamibacterales bacterium]|nr:hypothetical protein [Vicinamibacterales bacterium]
MRCPKCHYLSFEPEPRCRNCGFDLGDEPGADLSLRVDEPEGDALADLSMRDAEPPKRARSGLPPMRRRARGAAAARAAAPEELHDFAPLPARGERRPAVEPEPPEPLPDPEYIRQLDADLEEVRESASTEAREVDRPAPPADDDVADVADDSLADLRPIR